VNNHQDAFRCTIMRGGTSKAIFIKKNDLPADISQRDKVILAIFGSPDVRQIDGLGGSDITTSKVAIIGPPSRPDADVDYTFGQVQLTSPQIDWSVNCGNISSAVGPFAIDECMVAVEEPITKVRIHNVNTGKIIEAEVEVSEGKAKVDGSFSIDGVPGTGSAIIMNFAGTAGASTGKLLPTGNLIDYLDVPDIGVIPTSIVDLANTVAFVLADSIGATGIESPPELRANHQLRNKLEAIRQAAALACGFIQPGETALVASPIRPIIAMVAPPQDYVDYESGHQISSLDMDFVARNLFNQLPTDTFPTTATFALAAAAKINGTLVNELYSRSISSTDNVRFGHARGVNEVDIVIRNTSNGPTVERAIFLRTARRIMDGLVYVRRPLL